MDTQQLPGALAGLRFFAGLSDEEQRRLAQISRPVEFSAGTVIFSEGSTPREVYLLLKGRVELCMSIAARGCLPILTLEAGDLLGWSAALGGAEMTATAFALTDTEAIALASDRLQALCQQDHDIGYEIMHRVAATLSRRLVATRLQVLDLFADLPSKTHDPLAETPP